GLLVEPTAQAETIYQRCQTQGPQAHFHPFTYKKVIFRQFTDDSYSHEVAKPSWLGLLGPELKAEEKDTFIIHFKNFASWPYSVHLHRVFFKKDSEGKANNFFFRLPVSDVILQ
uniref:Plastocyanin-like domain-containing protein n=1 Tax=Laticauda laticaudata TaxID=8630 RepID=A0A8C5WS24_LATLA